MSWLRAEDGIPRRVKAAYLTDEEIIQLAIDAARRRQRPGPAQDGSSNVVRLREGDAA